jgi:hypothetical protein
MTGRVAEFLLSDLGGVTLSVRPPLPFTPDGVRVRSGRVELYGEGRRILLEADPEVAAEILQASGLLLIEHPEAGPGAPRETELQLFEQD